jgi:hypothetical protein
MTFSIASAIFAGLAAIFWFISARIRIPSMTWQEPTDNPFHRALRTASWWNVAASTCAGVSASLQAVARGSGGGRE